LEALPDPSLPHGGRHSVDGLFNLNELRAFSWGQPASLTTMIVVHDERQLFRDAIDGKIDSSLGWSNSLNAGKANNAVVATGLQRAPDDDLKVELYFSRGPSLQANRGRFRLSVSGAPAALDQEQKRFAVIKLTDPWSKLAAAYALNDRSDEAWR
jgi:hypothetical protein